MSSTEILRSPPHILRRTRHGLMLYNEHDHYMATCLSLLGEYSEAEAAFLTNNLRSGDVVIEVGANIGALTLPMAQKIGPAGRLYAFEAQRQMFQLLSANMALNGLGNVHAHHMAVGSTNGQIGVPSIDYNSGNNFGGVSLDKDDTAGEQVRLAQLDTYLDLERLRLIKADVEGMELDVLKGAEGLINRHRPILYLENNLREKSSHILGWLFDHQYRIFWHFPPLWSARNFYGHNQDPFIGPNGKSIISVNIIACPAHFQLNNVSWTEIHDPMDWWQKAE